MKKRLTEEDFFDFLKRGCNSFYDYFNTWYDVKNNDTKYDGVLFKLSNPLRIWETEELLKYDNVLLFVVQVQQSRCIDIDVPYDPRIKYNGVFISDKFIN